MQGDENLIIMDDWNMSVGDEPKVAIVSKYGLGRRNKEIIN